MTEEFLEILEEVFGGPVVLQGPTIGEPRGGGTPCACPACEITRL